MNNKSVAPCGVICDICLGFQREKNKCAGCNSSGNKPYHCTKCSIKSCQSKNKNEELFCSECSKFPCRRIKDLDKRYRAKYGESPMLNLEIIRDSGIYSLIDIAEKKWKCPSCGKLLCVHKNACLNCGTENSYFPK